MEKFIIHPSTNSVLTLKPDMLIKKYNNKSLIVWKRVSFNEHIDIVKFIVNKKYQKFIDELHNKQFIITQWSEYKGEINERV
jgi:CRISPR/Cas system CSM-associated protein Csm4 (group 5 of RAMP superfamily)